MEQPISRTVSSESTQSWQHLTTASGASAAGRKARSSEPETGGDNVERASVSVPPLGAKAIRQSLPARRPSKASDSNLFEYFGHAWSGSAVDDSDATPTLEGIRGNIASAPVNPLLLPDSFRLPRPDVVSAATDSKRLSISSFVSAISNSRGYSWSGRSSVADSEPEGTSYLDLEHGTFSHADIGRLTLCSKDGEPTRDNDSDYLALGHHIEPKWQSRDESLAYAVALSAGASSPQPEHEPHRPGPPRLSPTRPTAATLTEPDST